MAVMMVKLKDFDQRLILNERVTTVTTSQINEISLNIKQTLTFNSREDIKKFEEDLQNTENFRLEFVSKYFGFIYH